MVRSGGQGEAGIILQVAVPELGGAGLVELHFDGVADVGYYAPPGVLHLANEVEFGFFPGAAANQGNLGAGDLYGYRNEVAVAAEAEVVDFESQGKVGD